jgi:hypothetical protein
LLLVLGLVAGIGAPGLALTLRGWLPEMVALLLFIAALRIGPRQALGSISDLKSTVGIVLIFQVACPIVLSLVFAGGDFTGALATALVLALAASPISGSPNLTLMTGNDPAPSLRLLVAGTALLPLTVLPVFWLTPGLGSAATIIAAVIRLLVLITAAAAIAFTLRATVLGNPEAKALRAIDGASAIVMAVLVIGLMSAVGPALRGDQAALALNLAAAFAINFGLQLAAALLLRSRKWQGSRAAIAIAAGNRNMALFLAALPSGVTDPLLLFIGCYQVPMYLTPLLLGWLYRAPVPAP